jgi:ankyrin repeat protein
VARRLVELGAPVTDFFTAAYLGLTEPLAALLAAGEDVEARTLGLTPLMWASKRNNAECVTALLALGASAAAEDATLAAVEEEDN